MNHILFSKICVILRLGGKSWFEHDILGDIALLNNARGDMIRDFI